jgi:hypothetical protein
MSAADPTDLRELQENQAEAIRKAQLAAEQDAADFKWLMESKRGRRLMWRLLDKAGCFRSSFDTSALRMAMLEGQRNYGLTWLNEIMAHAPDKFELMLTEQKAT